MNPETPGIDGPDDSLAAGDPGWLEQTQKDVQKIADDFRDEDSPASDPDPTPAGEPPNIPSSKTNMEKGFESSSEPTPPEDTSPESPSSNPSETSRTFDSGESFLTSLEDQDGEFIDVVLDSDSLAENEAVEAQHDTRPGVVLVSDIPELRPGDVIDKDPPQRVDDENVKSEVVPPGAKPASDLAPGGDEDKKVVWDGGFKPA